MYCFASFAHKLVLSFLLAAPLVCSTVASAQKASSPEAPPQKKPVFVAPPRTIADITAFLDQEKPDLAKRAKTEADANAEPPIGASRAALKDFYYRRAQARAAVGRLAEGIADGQEAAANSDDYLNEGSRIELFVENLMRLSGDYKGAARILERIAQKLDVSNRNKGRAFYIYLPMIRNLVFLAELDRAEGYVKKSQALFSEARAWANGQPYLSYWEAAVEEAQGRVQAARGRHEDAELSLQRAGALYRDASTKCPSWPNKQRCDFGSVLYYLAIFGAQAKGRQGRLAEAEIDIRQALLSRLKSVGKDHPDIANGLQIFSDQLSEQRRFAEAETIARASVQVFKSIGYSEDTQSYVLALHRLATAIFSQGRYDEAKEMYLAMDKATKSWAPERSAFFRLNWTRMFAHYFTRDVEKGIGIARESLAWSKAVTGEQHFNTAMTRAMLATGLTFARQDTEALQEFNTAIPVLLATTRDEDDEDATATTFAHQRLQNVLEANIALLARSALPNRAEESLRFADAIRGRSVQSALAAAAARAAARTPALSELVRREQDLSKRIQAQGALITNLLAEPPEQRQSTNLTELQQELDGLRGERRAARGDIGRRFPEYVDLIRPSPATAEDIRAHLKSDEALISFYFGIHSSFVWAVTKTGPVAMAALPINAKQLENKVRALRVALDPSISTIDAIPAFDVAAAHELYQLLLKPVEEAWRPAKSLIVVTNGALDSFQFPCFRPRR